MKTATAEVVQLGGVIPAGLDDMPPGPELAAVLGSIDVATLPGRHRVTVLKAQQRMVSHYQAASYRTMGSIVDSEADVEGLTDPVSCAESAAAEIGLALRLTRRSADMELDLALDLRDRLPAVWHALHVGMVDLRRVRVLVYGTGHVSDSTAREVVGPLLEAAGMLTTGELSARLRRLCIAKDPDDAARRYELGIDARRVVAEPDPSGTCHLLGLDLPPDRVAAITGRLDRIARNLKRAGEARSMDNLRADALLDLLDPARQGTCNATEPRGVVEITVGLDTLARLSDDPGDLAGYGPVLADIARQVADRRHDALWRFVVTDTDSGIPIVTGTTRRRPTASQRRDVAALNRTCVFPGCRMPASNCDADHRTRWVDGGATRVDNLAPLCRRHHRIRHSPGWGYERLPNGDYLWTTPLGHMYTKSGRPP